MTVDDLLTFFWGGITCIAGLCVSITLLIIRDVHAIKRENKKKKARELENDLRRA